MIAMNPGSLFAGRQFRVIKQIGAGGMGAVFEAEQLSTRKHRALKVLTQRFGTDEKAQTRFVREATVGADINSAHVVDVIGAGIDEESGLPWLAMELLEGIDLRRVVDLRGRLAPQHMRTVFQQLGHGLSAAHDAGVIHRDLKPENIFIARSRRANGTFTVKILDFGIAKIARESVVSTDTATIGSPMWMAPEQINADALSPRTDVWALGLLAFWAVTGRVYWQAAYRERVTVQALFAEQLFAELPRASVRAAAYGEAVAARIPPDFDDWFMGCVQREPTERFADAAAAMVALDSILRPWAEAAADVADPLLPEAGSPTPETRVNSGPALNVDLAHAHAEMAGTTAEMLSLQASTPTLHGDAVSGLQPSSASLSVETSASLEVSEDMDALADPLPSDARDEPVGPPPARRRIGWIAVPAALGGAVLAGAAFWGTDLLDDDDVSPSSVANVLPDDDDDDSGNTLGRPAETAGPERPETNDDGQETPPPVVRPEGSGRVDMSSLPTPVSVQMLGWTADGDRLALQAGYGEKVADGTVVNFVELIHVLSGVDAKVEASYLVDRAASPALWGDDPLSHATAQAWSDKRWMKRRLELLLRQPEPRRVPRRSGEVSLEVTGAPQGTKIRVQPTQRGFDLSWWGFEAVDLHDASPPTLHVTWVEAGVRTELVTAKLDEDIALLRELSLRQGEPPIFGGYLRLHWAPGEQKCLLVLDMKAGKGREALADRRWFMVDIPKPPVPPRTRIRGASPD